MSETVPPSTRNPRVRRRTFPSIANPPSAQDSTIDISKLENIKNKYIQQIDGIMEEIKNGNIEQILIDWKTALDSLKTLNNEINNNSDIMYFKFHNTINKENFKLNDDYEMSKVALLNNKFFEKNVDFINDNVYKSIFIYATFKFVELYKEISPSFDENKINLIKKYVVDLFHQTIVVFILIHAFYVFIFDELHNAIKQNDVENYKIPLSDVYNTRLDDIFSSFINKLNSTILSFINSNDEDIRNTTNTIIIGKYAILNNTLRKANTEKIQFFKKDINNNMLKINTKIDDIDLSQVEETSQITGLSNVNRDDQVKCVKESTCCTTDELLNNVPDRDGNLIIVPKVIEGR
jgi:Asp-tRNA(Asn)/Glu-tRNA(Gln) amidotransferase C subunit